MLQVTIDSIGSVALRSNDSDPPVKLTDLKDYDVFGEISVADPSHPAVATTTVTTTSPCFMLRASRTAFAEVGPGCDPCRTEATNHLVGLRNPWFCARGTSVMCFTTPGLVLWLDGASLTGFPCLQLMRSNAKLSSRVQHIRESRRQQDERTLRVVSSVLRVLAKQLPDKNELIVDLDHKLQAASL
jgi:hypothetical protein